MQSLIQYARAFPGRVAAEHAETYRALGRGQQPQAMFIACSDSRVVPSVFTGARPGDLFELRTAGNIVPAHRPGTGCAVAGTLEFAVRALDVTDIVVCGHSHCGAVQGLLRESGLREMPVTGQWLTLAGWRRGARTPARPTPSGESDGEPADAHAAEAAQGHVLTQLDHLRSHPAVAERLAEGRLRLHAWYYAVETGQVLACPQGQRTFRPL